MSVDEKPPDSGFQPDPTSVLMFGSLLTIVVARGAAFGEKAAAEPKASANTVLAILAIAATCAQVTGCSNACSTAYGGLQLERASLVLLQCSATLVKPHGSSRAFVCTDTGVERSPCLLTLGLDLGCKWLWLRLRVSCDEKRIEPQQR